MTTPKERMSEERWEELRKFDVGDPATWPAVEIDYGELLAEINALRAELTKAERGRNEIHADFTELESEGLRLQGLWLADIAKAERERDEARAALAQAREAIAAIARNADDATDLSLFRVQCRDFAKSALTPTQESETP